MKHLTLAAVMALMSAPAIAQDAAAGQEHFERQCVACHVIVNDAGETLAGRNAKTGPNLYGVIGRAPGTYPDFAYGDGIVAYGATGAVWGEENFLAYVQDPTDFLRTSLDDRRARGKMAFQVRDEQEARDLYAYLSSLTQ
jgi:cytochrome c